MKIARQISARRTLERACFGRNLTSPPTHTHDRSSCRGFSTTVFVNHHGNYKRCVSLKTRGKGILSRIARMLPWLGTRRVSFEA